MRKSKRAVRRVDPDVLDRQTSEINDKLEREREKMTAVVAYLQKRNKQNGFGRDFELTLRRRKTS